MDMDRIKTVIDLMCENELSEFAIEEQDFKLSLKRGGEVQMVQAPVAAAPAPAAAAAPAEAAPAPEDALTPIESPLVGTFYRAGSPDAEPFASVGTSVSKNTVICIIEAMKVMNEIKAETSGVIKKVMIENGTAVQFGQSMFLIEKS